MSKSDIEMGLKYQKKFFYSRISFFNFFKLLFYFSGMEIRFGVSYHSCWSTSPVYQQVVGLSYSITLGTSLSELWDQSRRWYATKSNISISWRGVSVDHSR